MHPSVLLLFISVPWMILDRVSSSVVPSLKPKYDDSIEMPDIREVILCTSALPNRTCYTFIIKADTRINVEPISDSETRARREVSPQVSQAHYEDEEDVLEQQRYAKEREQELLDLRKEQEALARKG